MIWRLALVVMGVVLSSGISYGANVGNPRNPDIAAEYQGFPQQWQWRYWVSKGGHDLDRRLDQTVGIEIVGRALVPALALLSEKSGVSLQVTPKDKETLGERKLILVVQEASLKAMMVQLTTALPGCYWDIDWAGDQPIYYLCRYSGTDSTGWSPREAARQAELAGRRAERLEAVRRALPMSPEELREFEKDDLFLARAMRDPERRADAALFGSLPSEQMRTFVDTGRVQPRYADLSGSLKEGLDQLLRRMTTDPNSDLGLPGRAENPIYGLLRERIDRWREDPQACVDFVDTGPAFGVGVPGVFLTLPIPAKFPTEQTRSQAVEFLNREGVVNGEADTNRIVTQWIEKGRAQAQEWDSSEVGPGEVPTDPNLLRVVRLRASGRTELAQLQQDIASKTGLNLISDYFTESPVVVSGSLTQQMPLWRLLNALSAESNLIWKKAGDYLVFYHAKWSYLAAGEIPESLLSAYRRKLTESGHLTIGDAARFAAAWKERTARFGEIPEDLQKAGLSYPTPELLLYASLTPEQVALAHDPPGLSCRELSAEQKQQLIYVAHNQSGRNTDKTDDIMIQDGYFRVEETNSAGRTTARLFVQFGKAAPRFPATYIFPEAKHR